MDFGGFWRILVDFGWILGGFWVDFGGFWWILVDFGWILVDFGGFWVDFGRFWRILVDLGGCWRLTIVNNC